MDIEKRGGITSHKGAKIELIFKDHVGNPALGADLAKKNYSPMPALAAPIIDKAGFKRLNTDAYVKHFASDLPAEGTVLDGTPYSICSALFTMLSIMSLNMKA